MKYIKKDISSVKGPAIIIHGVNCQGVMRSGVAKALFTKWPQVKNEYINLPKEEVFLGNVSVVNIKEESIYILNCLTQDKYGYDGLIYASPEAIKECLLKVVDFSNKTKIRSIYTPMIGSGLGGLSWENQVKSIFEDIAETNPQIEFSICDII